MPTKELFNAEPPFPVDVATIGLRELSYEKLLANDRTESARLLEACKETGFFLLNLQGSPAGGSLLRDAEGVFELDREVSALSRTEKWKSASRPPVRVFGWKEIGAHKIDNGKPDRYEFYGISEDSILGNGAQANPSPIEESRALLQSFAGKGRDVCNLIFSHLEAQLGYHSGILASLHQSSQPSMTTVRLMHYPPQAAEDQQSSLHAHTDNGSVTVLFNVIGGLQILPPELDNEESNWRWVRPEPGCAIVNLGDSLVQWSGGILHSNMHRVVNAPGLQAQTERYSVAYVLKPNNDAPMHRLVGEHARKEQPLLEEDDRYTYAEWHGMKSATAAEGKNMIKINDAAKLKLRNGGIASAPLGKGCHGSETFRTIGVPQSC